MKSLMRLLLCVLEDSSTWCRTSTTRDWLTITRRVEHEGLSFLTITLPSFAQWFERSLADEVAVPSRLLGFKSSGSLPLFLRGLTEQVFDASTGVLRDSPSIDAIYYIRQICLMYKKVLLPCTENRVKDAFDGFITCENDVSRSFEEYGSDQLFAFRSVSRLLWGKVLQVVNRKVRQGCLLPKHGPGATAERTSGNRKFEIRQWHSRLDAYFPLDQFAIPNWNFTEDLERINVVEPGAETPVRVITVPKTLRTPRIIAIEPTCMQYTQQAILRILVPELELHPLTRGRLNFTDQTVNQKAVLKSSRDESLATLDMKEASDRVPVKLVEVMLESVPDLLGAILACRSTTADVPGHGVKPLAKFASMGSALCFPIEAMVFYTIVALAILKSQGLRLTGKNLDKVCSGVRIYGDDIIVPIDYVQAVMCELESFRMIVNQHKSFFTGKFRESCGVDAYDGVPVTPVYVRRMLPASRRDTSELLSAISLRNQLYEKGSWRACQFLSDHIERIAPFPIVERTSPVQGRYSYVFTYEADRTCPFLHKPLVRGVTVSTKSRKSLLDSSGALLKFFLYASTRQFSFTGALPAIADSKHLERHGRPDSVDIKIRWASPY